MGHLRVCIGMGEIAGWGVALEKGLQKQGCCANFYSRKRHPFMYREKENKISRFLQCCDDNLNENLHNGILHFLGRVVQEFLMLLFLFYTLCKYNIFVFIFHNTILWHELDLPILKLFHKKVIIIECGDDIRPPYISGSAILHNQLVDIVRDTKKQKAKAVWSEKYANYIISHPPMALLHEKPCIQMEAFGLINNIESYQLEENWRDDNGVTTILHAPSVTWIKGTEEIRKIIYELQEEGYRIKYIEIQGKTNEEVIAALKICDFVVDQVYSDTPLAGFATEAAHFGKPAVVGGEYASYIAQELSSQWIAPSVYVIPSQMKHAIRNLIENVTYRRELGKRAYAFVHNYWEKSQVIERLLRIIHDDIPPEYFFDPKDIQYIYGGYTSLENIQNTIRQIISIYGVDALQINDKPNIKMAYSRLMNDCCFTKDEKIC